MLSLGAAEFRTLSCGHSAVMLARGGGCQAWLGSAEEEEESGWMQELGSPGAGCGGSQRPERGVRMDPRGWYSFRSCWDMPALGSVLPSTLRGGLSQSSAWESLPAPARGQIDVLQHGTMLGHPSMQLQVKTNVCCFTRIFAPGKCPGETAEYYPKSEHWHRAQGQHGCRRVVENSPFFSG